LLFSRAASAIGLLAFDAAHKTEMTSIITIIIIIIIILVRYRRCGNNQPLVQSFKKGEGTTVSNCRTIKKYLSLPLMFILLF
jgi:hypothetical protein